MLYSALYSLVVTALLDDAVQRQGFILLFLLAEFLILASEFYLRSLLIQGFVALVLLEYHSHCEREVDWILLVAPSAVNYVLEPLL